MFVDQVPRTSESTTNQYILDKLRSSQISPDLDILLTIAELANNAVIKSENNGQPNQEIGDPIDIALIKAIQYLEEQKIRPLVNDERFSELPFDSTRKRMSSVVKKDSQTYVLYTKGAPEFLIELCDQFI
ncbi:MAG: hypothetical protein ACC656_15090, partial [Candidatus Heimdallarchaeota archaeon]